MPVGQGHALRMTRRGFIGAAGAGSLQVVGSGLIDCHLYRQPGEVAQGWASFEVPPVRDHEVAIA